MAALNPAVCANKNKGAEHGMCGLSGEIRFDGTHADTGAVARMTDAMAPRGPDAAGLFAQSRCAFGHRRLKIIDLSEKAQQPLVDSDLGLTIAFNGCIYNYKALREELIALGYRFFSTGDTEVVLKSFHAWGPDCVKRLNGMFAFALWDSRARRLAHTAAALLPFAGRAENEVPLSAVAPRDRHAGLLVAGAFDFKSAESALPG